MTSYVVRFCDIPRYERTVGLIQGVIDWIEEQSTEGIWADADETEKLRAWLARRQLMTALMNLEDDKAGKEDWVGSRPVDPETGEYLPGGDYRIIE
jgi:hypothetical protein